MIKNSPVFFTVFFFVFLFCLAPPAGAGNKVINFYQEHISRVDGDRCPMYPSCSSYASAAIEKHGFVMGWIMACDRLVRCGRDEVNLSEKIIVNGHKLVFDPVEANDFWWFEKKNEK